MSQRSQAAIMAFIASLSLGAAGSAHAVNYAVSHTSINSFSLNFSGGAGSLMPFTFSTSTAAQGAGTDSGFGSTDAAASCVGAACVSYNNSFTSHGASGDYAYGDALITSSNVTGGVGGASSIGEISAASQAGFASGANSMTAFFSVLGAPGTATFSFNAAPYLQMSGNGTAFSSMSITISNGSGAQVFSWAPNGAVGSGISGGTETADGVNLNLGIGPNVTFNPGSGMFSATTNSLAAGTYTLNISMQNQVSAVPEADTLAMMLAGLGLIGFAVRRRTA